MKHYKPFLIIFLFAVLFAGHGLSRALAEQARPAESPTPESPLGYDDLFTPAALRVDLFHTGGLGEESFSLDRVIHEPLWPGRRNAFEDPTGYGLYRFRVIDAESGRLLFSQGFASLFGEWLTTSEAQQRRRTMHESVRFPFPRAEQIRVAVDKRNRQGEMDEIYSVTVEPAHHSVSWERRYDFPVVDIEVNGTPAETTDIVILGDGYTAEEMGKFRADARRFAESLFDYAPYRENRSRISIRAIEAVSRESGTDEPRKGSWRDTILGCTFNTFDSARYLTTEENEAMREIAALAPYDTIYIMVNTARYGGGGIFNLWSVFAADTEYAEYVYIHEFGHSFGGLGDEYYSPGATSYDDDMFYPPGVEPWEPNITALLDPANVPWADLIAEGTPIPTPATEEYADRIGVFEGAGYRARGLYRPCFDSIMFHKGHMTYCPVSERAIANLIRWTASGGW